MRTKTFTVMNKNHPVLDFLYDMDGHRVLKILGQYELDYAPLTFFDGQGNITKRTVNDWWNQRAIPRSRRNIKNMLSGLGIDSRFELIEANSALSLSDRYWVNDPQSPKRWEDINFFDNDFSEDLGFYALGQSCPVADPSFISPDATTGGNLPKKWVIKDGKRLLVKDGTGPAGQEVHNEVVATKLYGRLLSPEEFVPYDFHVEDGVTYCACPNMLGEDEEYVPVADIMSQFKKPNNQGDYAFLVECFEKLGLGRVDEYFAKMFTCDYILANHDRHYGNFGAIRNVETLEYTRFAPIFDTGSSLWCNKEVLNTPKDFVYLARPFAPVRADGKITWPPERLLEKLTCRDWFAPERLDGFVEEAVSILGTNPNLPDERIDLIRTGLKMQISKLT